MATLIVNALYGIFKIKNKISNHITSFRENRKLNILRIYDTDFKNYTYLYYLWMMCGYCSKIPNTNYTIDYSYSGKVYKHIITKNTFYNFDIKKITDHLFHYIDNYNCLTKYYGRKINYVNNVYLDESCLIPNSNTTYRDLIVKYLPPVMDSLAELNTNLTLQNILFIRHTPQYVVLIINNEEYAYRWDECKDIIIIDLLRLKN